MNKNIDIGGRLHSTATGNVVTGANEIFDDSKNKKQSDINTETYSLVNDVNERLSGLSPDQQSALNVAAKATNNETKLGYYVCDTEGNIAAKVISDATGYVLSPGGSMKVKMTNANTVNNATLNINSTGAKPLFYDGERVSADNTWEAGETVEVYYDGTNFYANNVAGSGGDGVFDVSEKYPTSGVEGGNTYTLAGALTVLNANLPASRKKGGMSIKFIQSSDNKYVQFRYMSSSTANADFTNITNWQGVDSVPIVGSKSLPESGGVRKVFNDLIGIMAEKSVNVTGQTTTTTGITLKNGVKYAIYVQCSTAVTASNTGLYVLNNSNQFTQIARLTAEQYAEGYTMEYTPVEDVTLWVRPYATGVVSVKVWDEDNYKNLNELNKKITDEIDALDIKVKSNFFNVNRYINDYTPYANTEIGGNSARQAVPVKYRKLGLWITFLTAAGWRTEQFVGGSDLDLSNNAVWRSIDYWKPVEGKQILNVNYLNGNLDTPISSLYDALVICNKFPEYKQKGVMITFLQASAQVNQLVINSESATANGTLTLEIDGNTYTVSYNNGETRNSIFTKIAALSITGYTVSYTSGDPYTFITADDIGNKSFRAYASGGLSISYRDYIKGTNKNWRTYQYINTTDLNYWADINYWQEIFVNKEENLYAYLKTESYNENGVINYNANGAISSYPVIWSDDTSGIYTSTDWNEENQMYLGYEVTYGSTHKVIQPAVTVSNYRITRIPDKQIIEL